MSSAKTTVPFRPSELVASVYSCTQRGWVYSGERGRCETPERELCKTNGFSYDESRKICASRDVCEFLGLDYDDERSVCTAPERETCKERGLRLDPATGACQVPDPVTPKFCEKQGLRFNEDNATCGKRVSVGGEKAKARDETRTHQEAALDGLYAEGLVTVDVRMAKDAAERFLSERPARGRCNWKTPVTKKFQWHEAQVVMSTPASSSKLEFDHAGIRKKSWCWSFDARKPSFRLDLAKYDEGAEFIANHELGARTLVLNNGKQDPSLVRQCLAYAVLRAMNIPAPRCNLARVSLNGVDLGVYANVEPVDDPLLRKWFGNASGRLVEIEGEDVPKHYIDEMRLRTRDATRADTIEALAKWVDLDEYVRFWAAETVLLHWDSYSNNLNNSYAYVSPVDNKLRFIAWGADQTFQGNYLDDARPFRRAYLAELLFSDRTYRKKFCTSVAELALALEEEPLEEWVGKLGKVVQANFSKVQGEPLEGQEELNCRETRLSWCLSKSDHAAQLDLLRNIVRDLRRHVVEDVLLDQCGMQDEDTRPRSALDLTVNWGPEPFRYGIGTKATETTDGWKLEFEGLGTGTKYKDKARGTLDSAMYLVSVEETDWEGADDVSFRIDVPRDLLDPKRHDCAFDTGVSVSLALRRDSNWIESRETCLVEGPNRIRIRLTANAWKTAWANWQYGSRPEPLNGFWSLVIKLVDKSGRAEKLSGHVFLDDLQVGSKARFHPDWRREAVLNGDCNVGARVLKATSKVDVRFDSQCGVIGGEWDDFYTGEPIPYDDVVLDRLVPYWNAHVAGGHAWTVSKRRSFAHDDDNYVVTSAAFRDWRARRGPELWRSNDNVDWRKAAERWRRVKAKHGLEMGDFEAIALERFTSSTSLSAPRLPFGSRVRWPFAFEQGTRARLVQDDVHVELPR